MSKLTSGQLLVFVLPSRRLVRPTADDDFVKPFYIYDIVYISVFIQNETSCCILCFLKLLFGMPNNNLFQ